MQEENNIRSEQRKTLRDFIPLIFAFYGGLILLSFFQNVRLYFAGVLDSIFNKSLLLLLLHHSGFTALIALVLAFGFNYGERKKRNTGFKTTRIILVVLLIIEGLLIAYYVQNYEALGIGIIGITHSENIRFSLILIVVMLALTIVICHFLHKVIASKYSVISRMYPFSIIVFSMFLAILNSEKKSVNENKTQHLITSITHHIFNTNTYEGDAEYPLLKPKTPSDKLNSLFNLKDTKPNIVVLVVEGLGSDFVGTNARFKGFTPGLDALSKESLYWQNFVSNSGTSAASLPMIMGSLPFGEVGFTHLKSSTDRHTLFSILKSNGYITSFNYGGNSAINRIDKFLDEERVDHILDRNSFGPKYSVQKEDDAGISLGFPDQELFRKWTSAYVETINPRLDVFFTLSSKNPFLIPNKEAFENKVLQLVTELPLSNKSKKLVEKNKEVFASLLYTDRSITTFIENYKSKAEFQNSIFIITGSHALTDIPPLNNLSRYQVPFMIYSPLIRTPQRIDELASHADIAPSILNLLETTYKLETPQQVAWLGSTLLGKEKTKNHKRIPLLRDINNMQDFIYGKYFLSGSSTYVLDENLNLKDVANDQEEALLKNHFNYFKTVNQYVIENNKIIPPNTAIWTKTNTEFSKTDMIWIESVFNGNDIDNAYNTARKLAFDKDWKRALLLCSYILDQTPRHADTEVLMGRIYSWQKNFEQSETILKEVIRKYPKYEEGYAALLDTYFWANTNTKAVSLLVHMQGHPELMQQLDAKIIRAKREIKKEYHQTDTLTKKELLISNSLFDD